MLRPSEYLNAIWYSAQLPPWPLRWVSALYQTALKFRKPVSKNTALPVVVIGNFTVGGTGKTPLLIAVVGFLKSQNFRVGVVSRGYGRQTKNALTVHADSNSMDTGDEPLLIAKRTGVTVRVDANRQRAVEFLQQQGCNLIVSDDGLQHRAMPRSVEIEVIDVQRKYGNGLLLPAGPMREPVRAVDLQVFSGLEHDENLAFGMQMKITHAYNLQDARTQTLAEFVGQHIHAIAGIGQPEKFFLALERDGLQITRHAFADHHPFVVSDIPTHGVVLMTEKDAVKCQAFELNHVWVVPTNAQLSNEFYNALLLKLKIHRGAYA